MRALRHVNHLWTDEPGQEYMLWNNVETKPGRGYPEGLGRKRRRLEERCLASMDGWPNRKSTATSLIVNFQDVYFDGSGRTLLGTGADLPYGSNWDEDTSSGEYPNNYHFYVPRLVQSLYEAGVPGSVPRACHLQTRRRRDRADRPGEVPRLSRMQQSLPLRQNLFQHGRAKISEVHFLLPARGAGRGSGVCPAMPRPLALCRFSSTTKAGLSTYS